MTSFDLSVIVALAPGEPEWGPTLAAVATACAGISTEVLLVGGPSQSALGDTVGSHSVRSVVAPADALVPVLWGIGATAAEAPVVAFLSSEFTVHPAWARTLLGHLEDPTVVGAAGAVALASGATASHAAMYLLRFAAFLPQPGIQPRAVANIPGDGAIYRRADILAHGDLLAEGFWEIEFHRRWLAGGHHLIFDPKSLVRSTTSGALASGMALRYRHGVGYGATMVSRHHHHRLSHVLIAPLLPLLLAGRIAGRAVQRHGGLGLLLRAAAPLLALSGAWSLGEAVGAAHAKRGAG